MVETITRPPEMVATLEAAANIADIGPGDVASTAEVVDIEAGLEAAADFDQMGPENFVETADKADVVADV